MGSNDRNIVVLFLFLGSFLTIAIFKNGMFEFNSTPIREIPTAVGLTEFRPSVAGQRYEGRAYESQESGCTVKLVDHPREKIPQRKLNPTCSFQVLDGYLEQTHQFHGEGTWYAPTPVNPGLEIEYHPTICSFDSVLNKKDGLRKCLQENQIKKIVITGDSNGRHFRNGILELLQQRANFTCEIKRSLLNEVNGKLEKDPTYFDVPYLRENKLTLSGSMSSRLNWAPTLYECNGNSMSVQVEYIHSGKVLDTTMYLSRNISAKAVEHRLHRADSVLEYLLKYYYLYRGFPDVWFYTPPFHNAINYNSLQTIELYIDMMLKLFSLYLPDTTQLIFLSDATQCPNTDMQMMSDSFRENWNVSRDERIHDMNQILYSELVGEVTRKSNYHVFLDATRVACPITCTWHHDPAHMLPIWYYKMAEYNVDLLCTSK